ncbi:MAG: acylneuraminate cytidylyltransferase, partial [Bacteroidota bacterium]
MKTLTVIQARMSSSRLPGKVLLPLAGKALICRMVERVQRAKLCGQVVVAITTDPADDVLEEICLQEGLTCFRGHPLDLLDRHYQAAVQYEADVILKIPSDCPL